MKQDSFTVSIWCLTYNHADYIRDALDGFLSQKVNFNYNILIYDDASTDGTSDIVRKYAERYPDIIEAVIEPRNRFQDFDRLEYILKLKRKYLTGKYVAYCEGDDCWIDCHKLQYQVNYMEKHPECTLCMHNAVWMDYSKKRFEVNCEFDINGDGRIMKPEEIIRPTHGHPPTASFLFRRELLWKNDFFFLAPIGDYPLQLLALSEGDIYCSSRVMSVYRWMTSGSYNSKMEREEELSTYFGVGMLSFLDEYDQYTNYRFHTYIVDKMISFGAFFIEHMNPNVSIEKAISDCRSKGYKLHMECEKYIPWLEKMSKQMLKDDYLQEETLAFVTKYKKIWIMGTGKYASVFAKQLINNGIEFEGFAVSEKHYKDSKFMGKEVIKLESISQENKGAVCVAILPVNKSDLEESLKKAGIENYYNPYDIKWV